MFDFRWQSWANYWLTAGHISMPSNETLEKFMVRVEQNAHAEAIEFYAEGASMRENQAAPRVGCDALVANERKVIARSGR